MSNLNKHAHSFFDTSEAFTLTKDDLEKKELQLIGFLRSVVPSDLSLKYFICNMTNFIVNTRNITHGNYITIHQM
jgi:hypothetical protein